MEAGSRWTEATVLRPFMAPSVQLAQDLRVFLGFFYDFISRMLLRKFSLLVIFFIEECRRLKEFQGSLKMWGGLLVFKLLSPPVDC